MKFTIAIHPDDYTNINAAPGSDAASLRWARLLEDLGHEVRWVNVRQANILDQLGGCDGFMWRWAHFDGMGRIAKRLLPVIEKELNLAIYPDQATCWHYDDKIAQAYLLNSLEIPIPRTWAWFDRSEALKWAASATYPLVLKLATGAGSNNVKLIPSSAEATLWINRLFSFWTSDIEATQLSPAPWKRRLRGAAAILLKGKYPAIPDHGFDSQSGYALFQEFLPHNDFDTRITVIGNRAFGFRRFNRPNDFRASGSGNFDVDPKNIDERFIRVAFLTAKRLRSQSCAIDGLYKNGECVVAEVSYTYVSSAVHSCPGHWRLDGDPINGHLIWTPGQLWPEEAQVADFIERMRETQIGHGCALRS
jgi:hypothetical protein